MNIFTIGINKMNGKGKIYSLQIIRAMAFLGVFLSHTDIKIFRAFGWWGVEVFFVLSGFLMMYQYADRCIGCSLTKNIIFGICKIKKLYPLYIITTFLMFEYFWFCNPTAYSPREMIARLIFNIGLVQEYIPIVFRTINGAAWFLCAILLFYTIFPWILKHIIRVANINMVYLMLLILFSIQLFLGVSSERVVAWGYQLGLNCPDLQEWIVYYCPLTRLIDGVIGITSAIKNRCF